MDKRTRPGVNFDAWVQLAREDPDRFESMRRQVVDHAIERAPPHRRERLRGLQWRIDRTRELAPNPMAACVSISQMMWDSLTGRDGLLDTLRAGPSRRIGKAAVGPLSRRH
jgi:hypothetical protein